MFEKASRLKLRFDTPQGILTVEDLWELPLTETRANRANLDDLAKDLNRQVKAEDTEESFVRKERKPAVSANALAFEIVKHIIAVKLEEEVARTKALESKAKKQQLLAIIAKKEGEQLEGASIEDLRKMVEEL